MPPPRTARSNRIRRARRGCGCFLLLAAFLCGILYWTGLPAPAANALLRHFLPGEIRAECDSLHHRPGEGFIVKGLRVFSPMDLVTPCLTATELRVNPSLTHRLRRGDWIGGASLVDARIQSDLGLWADDLVTRQPIDLKNINLRLRLNETKLELEQGSARLFGFHVNVSGVIPLTGWPARSQTAPPRREATVAMLRHFAASAAPHVALAERFTFETPPEVWVRFDETLQAANPLRVDVSMAQRGPSNLRGAEMRRIDFKARADLQQAQIHTLEFEDSEGHILSVSGLANLADSTATVEVKNTLPRYAVDALSPVDLTRLFARLAIRVEGFAHFDLRFGPSPFATFGNQLAGHLRLSDAFFRDASFPEVELDIAYDNKQLRIESLRGQVGNRSARGPVEGRVFCDFHTGEIEIEAKGAFKPEAVVSLLGPKGEKLLREWEFEKEPPALTFQMYRASDSADIRMDLLLSAKDVLSRGALFSTADLHVAMDEKRVVIDDLIITRGVELLMGSIVADRDFTHLDLDILSTLHLPEVAPILGPAVVSFLEPFRFLGSNNIEVKGRLDLSKRNEHNLSGTVNVNDLVWKWAKIDNISTPFTLKGGSLDLPTLRATLSGGSLTGSFASQKLFAPDGGFELSLDIRDADLFQIITAAADTTDTPYTGRLTLGLDLRGLLKGADGMPAFDSFFGKGSIRIQEGTLFRIPLLMGLSSILSKIVSGFGYAAQTDFTADFKIDAGNVQSENLFLSGRILSIAGEGGYQAYKGKIKANLRVQLLNQGVLSDALRVLLWPIRKLIEIQLTGTLEKPDWQPRNLPKELFGK